MRDDSPLPQLPPRDPQGHKGTFGTVLIVGGCAGPATRMIGAPALAARAALRAGAGLARLALPRPLLAAALVMCPSATGVVIPVDRRGRLVAHEAARVLDEQLPQCACVVVGPGLGTGEAARAVALRMVQQQSVPVVVDADAINELANVPQLHRDLRAAAIVTPHPGEYRRLARALNMRDLPADESGRAQACEALAQRLGCLVVLKGAGTVVSDGQRTWVNRSGTAVLATGGTGDVLAGLIAGLVAQCARVPQAPDLYDLTRLAVYAHGMAGEQWSREHRASAGLLAHELADLLPHVLEPWRTSAEPGDAASRP